MNSHATATQGGQTSVVGHHRGFSQPSVAVANSSADPWFLQSTGHQMPPTAPLRQNKRPAPQPTIASGANSAVGISIGNALGGSGNSVGVVGTSGGLLHQQQLSQSQPHIVPPNVPPHHHNNVINHHSAAMHLTPHALNNLTIASTHHSPKSPNQQQNNIHNNSNVHMLTFVPTGQIASGTQHHNSSTQIQMVPSTAAAVAAVTQQQQQQHLQLMSNVSGHTTPLIGNAPPSTSQSSTATVVSSSSCSPTSSSSLSNNNTINNNTISNNLMSSSMNAVHHSNNPCLPHKQLGMQQPSSLSAMSVQQQHQAQQSTQLTGGMSTSLLSFDINNTTTNPSLTQSSSSPSPWATTAAGAISPTTSVVGPLYQQRKCEVKLNAMPWFHGSITRDEAEHLLQPREDGLFLVRESTNFPGDYTLCVCFQGKVEHYRVKYLENKLTIDDEEDFANLGLLVAHYEADADGLCTQLVKCLPKVGKQEFCINSKDFLDKGWVIPENDLQLRESIGKGEFGDVMLGILRNEKVAVKMLKDEGAVQKFLAEASVMTTLEHENLVKFIGLVFTSKHIYLVTEYMSKGSLVDYLRSRGRQHITKKDQINFAFDTASGMEYLEAKKVVHRDLAARNVLISEDCIAKVSDFGLAREECYNLDVGKLPIKWTAPEALKNGRFSNKSDIWSFGILLWEIYSFGRVPYPRIPLVDVVKHVEVGYKMEAPEGCPSEIYEMMRQTWDLNPTKRPTFAELKVKLLHLKNSTA